MDYLPPEKKTINAYMGEDDLKIVEDIALRNGDSKRGIIYKILKPALSKIQTHPSCMDGMTFDSVPLPSGLVSKPPPHVSISLEVEEYQTLLVAAALKGTSARKLVYAILKKELRVP